MKIVYTKTFEKGLLKLEKPIQIQVLNKIDDLSQNKENLDIIKLNPKQLGFYRLRIGKFRIIFEYLDNNSIKLLKIDNRDSIYFDI